jgi:hypothetical protein
VFLQLTLDRLDLELMMRTGTRKQHKFARRLLPLISNPHWVLSTLVICNTGATQRQRQQQPPQQTELCTTSSTNSSSSSVGDWLQRHVLVVVCTTDVTWEQQHSCSRR